MRRVMIESPYAGDAVTNTAYARELLLYCLERGDAPFASHLLYPQVLDDHNRAERRKGLAAGYAWMHRADLVVVGYDLGVSAGMRLAIDRAREIGRPIEWLSLYGHKPEEIATRRQDNERVVVRWQ